MVFSIDSARTGGFSSVWDTGTASTGSTGSEIGDGVDGGGVVTAMSKGEGSRDGEETSGVGDGKIGTSSIVVLRMSSVVALTSASCSTSETVVTCFEY